MVERLLAHPVARQDQPPAARVPQRQAEHAVERVDEVDPPLLVEVGQHLGVAVGAEAVPAGFEPGAQRDVIVDLAVAHRDHLARLVGQRLRAARDVDDREPPAADAARAAHRPAVAVGTAMHERRAHAREDRLRVGPHHAVDAAHPSTYPIFSAG
jgi:hypothetical protein